MENHNTFQWYDGYNGQETVIFDDFREHQCKIEYLLTLTDRYKQKVAIKGGFTDWCPKVIFITSIMNPNDAISNDAHDPNNVQLLRRIRKVIHLTQSVEYPLNLFLHLFLLLKQRWIPILGLLCVTVFLWLVNASS